MNSDIFAIIPALSALIAALGWACPCHADVNPLDNRQKEDTATPSHAHATPDIFATYLFDPRKYNDLSIRAYVLQRQVEFYPSAPSSARDQAYKRVALEYLRRIGSGYSSDTVRVAQKDQSKILHPSHTRRLSDDDAMITGISWAGKVGYNMLVAYQPLVISNAAEGRLRYEIGTNAINGGFALGALGAPHTQFEARYYITPQPFIPIIPREYLGNAMDLVDQFAPMDRVTVTTTHRLESAGLSGRIRYAANRAVLSYGMSKTIVNTLVAHIIKEEDFSGSGGTSRSGVTALVSYAVRF